MKIKLYDHQLHFTEKEGKMYVSVDRLYPFPVLAGDTLEFSHTTNIRLIDLLKLVFLKKKLVINSNTLYENTKN